MSRRQGRTGRRNSRSARGSAKRKAAQKRGFRSGFEMEVADQMEDEGVEYEYEPEDSKLKWTPKEKTYLPDFRLKNKILIETKGRLTALDKQKILAVRSQHPDKDLRVVFAADNKLSPRSKMRYSDWARKNGIPYAIGGVPREWAEE